MKPVLARDVMKKDLVTVSPTETIASLAALLDEEDVHGVPVVDERGYPVGVVTRTDLARALAEETEETAAAPSTRIRTTEGSFDLKDLGTLRSRGAGIDGRVADIMSDRVVRAPETCTVGRLASRMQKEGVHRVLINKDRRLVGLVSATDLLGCLAGYERFLSAARDSKRR